MGQRKGPGGANAPPVHSIKKCLASKIAHYSHGIKLDLDLSPYNQNFDLGKSRQIFHHSLKEHHKISNIPKFRCEML